MSTQDTLTPESIEATAARMARDVDRQLARFQSSPRVVAGRSDLPPYVGPDLDGLGRPAVKTLHSHLPVRFTRCVACEHAKLETRLSREVTRRTEQEHQPSRTGHHGPGERDYALCKSCSSVNGTKIGLGHHQDLSPAGPAENFFRRLARHADRESKQYTIRNDPEWAAIVRRHTESRLDVDLRRSFEELRDSLREFVRTDQELERIAGRTLQLDDYFETANLHDREDYVLRVKDLHHVGHEYDAPNRAIDTLDHTLALHMDAQWEQRRQIAHRRAYQAAKGVAHPEIREMIQQRVLEAWNHNPGGPGENALDPANPLAGIRAKDEKPGVVIPREVDGTNGPEFRGVRHGHGSRFHTGIDEGAWDGEVSPMRHHHERVAAFLESKGVNPSALPPLNPGREIIEPKGAPTVFQIFRQEAELRDPTVHGERVRRAIDEYLDPPEVRAFAAGQRETLGPEYGRLDPLVYYRAAFDPESASFTLTRTGLVPEVIGRFREDGTVTADGPERLRADREAVLREAATMVRGTGPRTLQLPYTEPAIAPSVEQAVGRQEIVQAAELFETHAALTQSIRAARERTDGAREVYQGIDRAERGVQASGERFSTEITRAFEDPRAIRTAFDRASPEERAQMLDVMKNRPEELEPISRLQGVRKSGLAGALGAQDPEVSRTLAAQAAQAGQQHLKAQTVLEAQVRAGAHRLGLEGPQTAETLKRHSLSVGEAAVQEARTAKTSLSALEKVPTARELTGMWRSLAPAQRQQLEQVPSVAKALDRALRLEPRGLDGPSR